jgi:hypothetical protein
LHRTWAEAITDFLQSGGVPAGTESVIQGFIVDAGFLQLPFGPFVAIQPQPDRKGRIGIGLPERCAPFRIPEIEIEVIDQGHLATPIHVRVTGLLLPFPRPRSPDGGFLLRHADQHHPVFAFPRRSFQIGPRCFFFLLSLFEVHNGNMLSLGIAIDSLYIRIADFAKRGRRRNWVLPLPPKKRTYIPHGLEFGYVSLEKDAVDGTASERHVVPE